MTKAKLNSADRLEGVGALAEKYGCTREWIWKVRTGKGKSARIEKALRRAGITVIKSNRESVHDKV